MDKYGEFYGHDRISELLGMDKAALDFSDAHEKRKPKKDSSFAAVWVKWSLYCKKDTECKPYVCVFLVS